MTAAQAPAVPYLLAGVYLEAGRAGTHQVELGIGTTPTLAATIYIGTASGFASGPNFFQFPIPIEVPASTKIMVRIRYREVGGGNSVIGTNIFRLGYYDAIPANVTTTTALLKTFPNSASFTLTTSSTAWANSAWSEVTPATSEDWNLASVVIVEDTAVWDISVGDEMEIDVGVGASGSEVVVTTVRIHIYRSSGFNPGFLLDEVLVGAIPSGARVALRVRHRQATALTFKVALWYYGGTL